MQVNAKILVLQFHFSEELFETNPSLDFIVLFFLK